jgi:hypothetical protein
VLDPTTSPQSAIMLSPLFDTAPRHRIARRRPDTADVREIGASSIQSETHLVEEMENARRSYLVGSGLRAPRANRDPTAAPSDHPKLLPQILNARQARVRVRPSLACGAAESIQRLTRHTGRAHQAKKVSPSPENWPRVAARWSVFPTLLMVRPVVVSGHPGAPGMAFSFLPIDGSA